jgi:hypothetical protein
MEIIYIVLLVIGLIVAVYWIFMPFMLLGRLDKIFDSTERLNANFDAFAKGVEQYINKPKPKEG